MCRLVLAVAAKVTSSELFSDLRLRIGEAFPKEVIGIDPNVVERDATLNYECATLLASLGRYRHWGELTTETLLWTFGEDAALLGCLPSNVYPRVLPSFLMASLDCLFEARGFTFLTNCQLSLSEEKGSDVQTSNQRKTIQFKALSDSQRCVVRAYLEDLEKLESFPDELHARSALSSYWG